MVRCGVLLLLIISSSFYSKAQTTYSLSKCVEIAFENNISLGQNELDIESSKIQLEQSKAARYPSLNGFGSHGYNWGQTIDPFTNQFATSRIQSNSFGLNAGINLFNGFALQNQVKVAEVNAKISELGLDNNRNNIALAVANSYLSILFGEEFNKVNEYNLNASQEQLARVQLLVDAGQVPQANLYQVQAQVASDQARLIQSENDIVLAYLNLTQLIQLPEDQKEGFRIEEPNLDSPEFSLPDKTAVLLNALSHFPEVESANLAMLRAELNYKIAKGSRLPSLRASYNYGTGFSGARQTPVGDPELSIQPIGAVESTGQVVSTLVPSFSEFETVPFFEQLESNVNRSLFFNLSIPIFNGWSNRSNIQLAEIGKRSAALTTESIKNQLTQAVESAYADASASYRNYEASELALKAQEEAFKYAQIRYEQQVINAVDFGQARSTRDAAKADMIRNRYDYIFKLKILEFYQGKSITLN